MVASRESIHPPTLHLLRLTGYGLLILTSIDFFVAAFPPRISDTVWILQTIQFIVDRVVVPMLGIALVFFGGMAVRTKFEPLLLKILSWSLLLVSVLFLLSVPIGITNASQLRNTIRNRVTSELDRGIDQIERARQEVEGATDEQLQAILDLAAQQESDIEASTTEELREELLNRIATTEQGARTQAESAQAQRFNSILESSLQVNVGAVVSSAFFLYAWRFTKWARVAKGGAPQSSGSRKGRKRRPSKSNPSASGEES